MTTAALEAWWQELRQAARRLARRPGATAVVVVTLALGIGASTTVFTAFNVVVLGALPFGDTDELVRIRETRAVPGQPDRASSVAGRNFRAWQERAEAFTGMAAARYRTLVLTGDGEPERVEGIGATWNHFRVLGVQPRMGRVFQADEDRPGAPAPVAVISHSLWTRRFGRDPSAVGRDLVINGRPHTILGVMPRGFRYPYGAEVWVPLGLGSESEEWSRTILNISARLAPGTTFEGARAEMERIAARMRQEAPELNADTGVRLVSIRDEVLEGVDEKVSALLWAAAFVLLIACANVASMVLARMQRRESEVAVRVALGAGRADLARPILAEGLLVSTLGGLLGLLLAGYLGPPLAAMSPVDDLGPFFQEIGVDGRVGLFALGASLAVAVLFSLPAVLRSVRTGSASLLRASRGSAGGRRERRVLDALVAGEMAVAMVLLTGAGLMVKSALNLRGRDLGVEPEGLFTVSIAPSVSGYEAVPERLDLVDRILTGVRSLPGVEAAALTNFNPMRDNGWGASLWPEGRPARSPTDRVPVNHRGVGPGFFETAGIEILGGRGFTRADDSRGPGVVVVSETLARELWPEGEAPGKRVRAGRAGDRGPLLTVVGVAEDVADYGELEGTWYRPYAQDPSEFPTRALEIWVRTSGSSEAVLAGVRRTVAREAPDVPVYRVESMDDVVAFERRVEDFTTVLLSAFAGLGLLLAAVGIYGVLSYMVGRRTRELGVRMALGARPGRVMGLVLKDALLVSGSGLAVGLAAAGLLTRFLESFLFGVSPLDASVFGIMAGSCLVVALVAAWLPALRATGVEPTRALAAE